MLLIGRLEALYAYIMDEREEAENLNQRGDSIQKAIRWRWRGD